MLSIAAAGLISFAVGDVFQFMAHLNMERQSAYINGGVAFTLTDSFSANNIKDDNLRQLVEKDFFRKAVIEDKDTAAVKGRIPSIREGLYFEDAWDLLWYLEFVRDRDGLYVALDELLSKEYFKEKAKCLDRSCGVQARGSNVNADDGEQLFGLVYRNFVVPSLQAYETLAFKKSQELARDAILLARKVDLDPAISSDAYDRVLVVGSVLLQAKAAAGKIPFSDLSSLDSFFDGRSASVKKLKSPEIIAYLHGIRQLRAGCFRASSDLFLTVAEQWSDSVLADLFYFLAVRAISRPFFAIGNLTLKGEVIFVDDCDEQVAARTFLDILASRYDVAKKAVQHIGLSTDLDYYYAQAPLTGERRAEIIEYLKVQAFVKGARKEEPNWWQKLLGGR